MNKRILNLGLGWVLLCFLSACGGAGGPGPRTWIDTPLDGDTFALGAVIVRSHASSDGGTASAALFVNGAQVRVDNVADPAAALVEISQVWEPSAPGDYVLQVITTDHSGNEGHSNSVLVHITGDSPTPTPLTGTETPTLTPAAITDTATVAPSIPAFTLNKNGNCRVGPSTDYEVDTAFSQGQTLQIDGKSQFQPFWWWVLIPGSSAHCWISDSTGLASGPTANVQTVAAPPLPVTDTAVPVVQVNPPGNFNVADKSCTSEGYIVTLSWGNVSDENGYRIFRDGQLVTTLPANTTSYDDNALNFNSHSYYVQAYNANSSADSQSQNSAGCLF